MSVELGPRFDPGFEGIPPHVSSEDLVLWEEFRRRSSKDYVAFYFDVSLGTGEEIPQGISENVGRAWQRLTRFRADVVGDTGTEWHLIELRPNAGPGAVGSVQTYMTLWTIAPPDGRKVVPIIVTDRCSRDIRVVSSMAGVEVRCLNEPL